MTVRRDVSGNGSRLAGGMALLLAVCLGSAQASGQAVTLVPSAVRYAGIGTDNRGYNADFGAGSTVALNNPSALAIDRSGNLLIADSANNCVRRQDTSSQHLITTLAGLTVTSGGDTCSTATNASPSAVQGLLQPSGVAADANNNVYIADTGHNCVRELPAGSTGTASLITVAGSCGAGSTASTTPVPTSLAVDTAGNLYITVRDTADSIYQVLRHTAGSASGAVCRVAGAASTQAPLQCADIPVSPALLTPSAVTFDGAGDLYIADTGNNCVRKLTGGAFVTAVGTCGSAASAVPGPTGLSVSASGNLLISESAKNQVVRYNQASGVLLVVAGNPNGTPGAYAATQDGAAASSLPLNAPSGLVTDANNNLFVADAGNSIVRRLGYGNLFPQTTVGQASSQQVLTFQINTAGNLTVTPGQDYAIVPGTNNCNGAQTPAAAGSSPSFCSVGLMFTPTAPGSRNSPLAVADSTSLTTSAVGLQGVGLGPLAQLFPGQAGTLASGLGTVLDVNRDSSNRVYVLHQPTSGSAEVVRYPSGGGAPTVIIAPGTGLQNPQALASDAAGNWYVTDQAGSTTGTPSVQRYGSDGSLNRDYIVNLVAPRALRVDGFGNVVLVEQGSRNDILKIYTGGERRVVAGGGTLAPTEGAQAAQVKLTQPTGVALGPDGSVYIADAGARRVYSIDTAGVLHVIAGNGTATTTSTQSALGQGFTTLSALEVDAAGDLFLVDAGANKVITIFAAAAANNNDRRLIGTDAGTAGYTGDGGLATLATVSAPAGITLSSDGKVFLADTGNGAVRSVTFPNSTLDFGSPAVNSVTTQTQSLWNDGNIQLLRTGTPVISNPAFVYNNGATTCGSSVAAGVLCDIAISFEPTTLGKQTGTANVLDNAPSSPQVINLTGTAVPAAITSFTASAETETYGGPYVGTASVATNGGTVPQGTLTFQINGSVVCTVTGQISGTVSCTLPGGTLLPVAGSPYSVIVTFTGNYPTQTANTTLTELPRTLTEVVNSKSKVYLAANPPLDGAPNGLLPGVGSDSFAVTYGFGKTPITTGTLPGVYQQDVVATVTPNGTTNPNNYTIQVTPGDFTVTRVPLPGFGAAAESQVYGGAYTGTATYTQNAAAVAPTGTVQFRIGSTTLCSAAVSANTSCTLAAGTGLQAGTYTATVTYSGDSNYAATTITTPLTVTPAPLNITVANQTKLFGAPVPNLNGTATVTGLVNGDAVGTTLTLAYATTVTAATPNGTYPNSITVTVTGSSANSYTVTNVPGSFTVTGNASVTSIMTSAGSAPAGTSLVFTVRVTPASGTQVASGTVIVTSDGAIIGTATLDATGGATLTTTALTPGTHTITATYSGNANLAGSAASVTQVVTVPSGSFRVTTTPEIQLIRGSGSMTYGITVTALNGFAGPIALTCSGLPADATCAIANKTLTLAVNGTATTTLTTTTTEADAVVAQNVQPTQTNWPGALAITAAAALPMQLSGLGLLAAGIRRRKASGRVRLLWLLVVTVGTLGLAGCGCPSTAFHTYPVTVTATSVNGGPSPVTSVVYISVGQKTY